MRLVSFIILTYGLRFCASKPGSAVSCKSEAPGTWGQLSVMDAGDGFITFKALLSLDICTCTTSTWAASGWRRRMSEEGCQSEMLSRRHS